MNTDYRKLCIELFGTDDVEKLRQIAKKTNTNRNAGRKRKFTAKELAEIEKMLENGATINAIAEHYGTSRQIVDKYINTPPEKNYTLRMTYMYKQYPCTIIDVDFLNERIAIRNRTPDILHRAFGTIANPTWKQFEEFLADRCYPATRGNIKSILKNLGIDSYDTLQIAEKTNGRTADDDMWLKFKYYPMGGADYAAN